MDTIWYYVIAYTVGLLLYWFILGVFDIMNADDDETFYFIIGDLLWPLILVMLIFYYLFRSIFKIGCRLRKILTKK